MRNASLAKSALVLVATVVLGILVSVQWSTGAARSTLSADHVARTIRRLELEQEDLKHTMARLRGWMDARQRQSMTSSETLQDLRAELRRQKMWAGLIDVRGPGVQVILDDSPRTTGASQDLLIHDFDLRDVIGVLWLAGAEAISVNGERVVSTTSVACVGSTVLVNDTRLSPPYRVSAIGDPVQLQDYLRNPGYLTELKARSARMGLYVEFVAAESLTIPAYRGSLSMRYAQPGR